MKIFKDRHFSVIYFNLGRRFVFKKLKYIFALVAKSPKGWRWLSPTQKPSPKRYLPLIFIGWLEMGSVRTWLNVQALPLDNLFDTLFSKNIPGYVEEFRKRARMRHNIILHKIVVIPDQLDWLVQVHVVSNFQTRERFTSLSTLAQYLQRPLIFPLIYSFFFLR